MAKKKQKSFKEFLTADITEITAADISSVLNTDITTHSLMAMAVFGLVVSGFATTVLGAGFVMAYGNELGQTDNAAAVAVAIDGFVGSSTQGGDHHYSSMPPSAVLMPHGDRGPMGNTASGTPMMGDMRMGSSSMPSQMGSSTASCKPLQIARTLVRGMIGDDVTNLQNTLISQGLLASTSATGFFGALTERAVGQWQMQQGIASSSQPDQNQGIGMVGPKTRALFAKCVMPMMHDLPMMPANASSTNGMPPPPPMGSSTIRH